MINNKTVIAITLARAGSKRIPHKNMSILNGNPLISYTTTEVCKSRYIDKYVISTDDEQVVELCKKNQIQFVIRPAHLATDTSTSASAILHVLESFLGYDYCVEVMCTNPLKTVEDIDGCIEKLHITDADSVVSVCQLFDHHPSRIKYIENDILKDFYPEIPESRRQDLVPYAYVRNGSIYAMKVDFIKTNQSRYDKNTRPYIMPAERSVNIDEPVDLLIARSLVVKNDR